MCDITFCTVPLQHFSCEIFSLIFVWRWWWWWCLCYAVESSGGGVDLHHRLMTELLMLKDSVMIDDGLCASITIPIMEDLHLRKFPPVDAAHCHLDFTCLRNSANLSTEQQVTQRWSGIVLCHHHHHQRISSRRKSYRNFRASESFGLINILTLLHSGSWHILWQFYPISLPFRLSVCLFVCLSHSWSVLMSDRITKLFHHLLAPLF